MIARTLVSLMCLVLVFGVAAQDEDAKDSVTLKWKLKKGDEIRYELTQSFEMDMGGMGINQEMLYGIVLKVTEVDDDGKVTFKATYDRTKISGTGFTGQESDYDSDKGEDPDEDDMMASVFHALKGKSFTLQMSARGNVTKVEGFEDIVDEILEDIEDDTGMAGQMVEQQFSDEQIRLQLSMVLADLPENAVEVGKSWDSEETLDIPNLGELKAETKSTLKELKKDGDVAVIGTQTKMEPTEDGGGGMVEISEATGKGKVEWDVKKGRLNKSSNTTTMVIEAGGQEIEIIVKGTMKYKPKKKKDVPSEDKKDKDDDK